MSALKGPITTIKPVDREHDVCPLIYRYLGSAAGDAYSAERTNASTSEQQIVVRMRPERWLTADYTSE